MPSPSPQARAWITAALLAGSTLLVHGVSHGERKVLHAPLQSFPLALDSWQGQNIPLDPRIIEAVGVDDYLNRVYVDDHGNLISLYIGYYASQRTGDTIHSPKNCLPGSGWQPLESTRLTLAVPDRRPVTLNSYLIAKGLERDLVFYWYQERGLTMASEYSAKFYMITDAIMQNRTDGALVRLVTPTRDGADKARARLVDFTRTIFPHLSRSIPD